MLGKMIGENQGWKNDRGVVHYQFIIDMFGRVVLGANVYFGQ